MKRITKGVVIKLEISIIICLKNEAATKFVIGIVTNPDIVEKTNEIAAEIKLIRIIYPKTSQNLSFTKLLLAFIDSIIFLFSPINEYFANIQLINKYAKKTKAAINKIIDNKIRTADREV